MRWCASMPAALVMTGEQHEPDPAPTSCPANDSERLREPLADAVADRCLYNKLVKTIGSR
jgi:hypothetical protein